MPKKPKAKPAHQRVRRSRKKTTGKRPTRKKPQNLVVGFGEEARRQLSQQAGLDPEQPLKYGSGIPTVAPEQLPATLDDGTTITPLGNGVVWVDGPSRVWHETPKPWLEENFLANCFREFCGALGVKLGPDRHRPSKSMLQLLCITVIMQPQELLQDVIPRLKGLYFLAKDYLERHPPEISEVSELVDWLKTNFFSHTPRDAVFKEVAPILNKKWETVKKNYYDGRGKRDTVSPLSNAVAPLDGAPARIWRQTPKAQQKAFVVDCLQQFCRALGANPGLDARPPQLNLQLFCRAVIAYPQRLLQDVSPLLKGLYFLAEDYLNRQPLKKISQPESIENLAAQIKANEPTLTKTVAREIAAQIHGLKPKNATTYRRRHNRRLRKNQGPSAAWSGATKT